MLPLQRHCLKNLLESIHVHWPVLFTFESVGDFMNFNIIHNPNRCILFNTKYAKYAGTQKQEYKKIVKFQLFNFISKPTFELLIMILK